MTTDGSDWRRLQLERTLEQWRASNFDPHVVLGIPVGVTPEQIVDAHRRWVAAYHPDLHENDPLATELTKRLNAARDESLGKGQRVSKPRNQQRRYQATSQQQRAQEAEIRRELARKRQEAERLRQNEERRGSSRSRIQRDWHKRRIRSRAWTILALMLLSIVAIYMILTITAPHEIDSKMEEWAKIFS